MVLVIPSTYLASMKINDDSLIRAYAKKMVTELRIAEGGETITLLEELEESQGAIDTIREFLDASGDKMLRNDQIQQRAIDLLVATTGRTPYEIASIIEGDSKASKIQKIETKSGIQKITARKPRSFGAPEGDAWTKCKEDFVYFCQHALEITYRAGLNPDFPLGGYGAFSPNEHQVRIIAVLIDDWLNGKPVRDIILKARQLGITTILLAFWYWLICQTDDFVLMFIIDKDPHMYEKRDMLKRWAEKVTERFPEAPVLVAHGGKRLVWSNRSKVLFESAQSPNPGTSEHIRAIHLSEMPKWPKGKAQKVMKSLVPGIPDSGGTFIVNESTAEGMGYFYRQWNRIMNNQEIGRTKTRPLFLPWHLSPEYSEHPTDDCYDGEQFIFMNDDIEVCETDDYGDIVLTEEEYMEKFNLKIDQIYWRRLQIKNKFGGVITDFDQEYPTTPEHAWAAFGSLFFGTHCSIETDKLSKEPIVIGRVVDEKGNNDPLRIYPWNTYIPIIVADRTGPLRIYTRPLKGETYYIGGDLAEGKQVESSSGKADTDFSVLTVLDKYGELVAIYRARTKPEEMALIAIMLAKLYNVAAVNIERNSVGEACWVMFKQSGYNKIYLRQGNGPYEDRGWNKTMPSNRKSMLIEMRHHIRRFPEHVVDKAFAQEIGVFVTNKDGKPEAMSGEHDDIIMAYCHGWHMIYDIVGVRIRIKEEEPEPPAELEFYNVLEHNGIDLDNPFNDQLEVW